MTIKIEDFDLDNILIVETLPENIIFYNILFKALTGAKPFFVRVNKVHRYDGPRYLVLCDLEKYTVIFSRVRYLIRLKSDIT